MLSQCHINTPQINRWYRCKRLEFAGETATWELNPRREYDLLGAYEPTLHREPPHRELIQATDDAALRLFVKAWGPLRFQPLDSWIGTDPVEFYRQERDRLRAWAWLFAAIEKSEGLHKAVVDLLSLGSEPFGRLIRERLGIPTKSNLALDEDDISRVWNCTASEILDICSSLVGSFPVPEQSLEVRKGDKALTIHPALGTWSLLRAIYWMFWQDIFMENPIQFCAECSRLIDFKTKRDRKFCSYECAHRSTGRESAKRNAEAIAARRKAAREAARRKKNDEGRKHGTQKTR